VAALHGAFIVSSELAVFAVIAEREPVRRILEHLGLPAEPPLVARARDPTEPAYGHEPATQLALDLG
jgi:hypothetical protein